MKLKFTRKTWYFFLLAAAAVSMLGGFAVLGGMDFSGLEMIVFCLTGIAVLFLAAQKGAPAREKRNYTGVFVVLMLSKLGASGWAGDICSALVWPALLATEYEVQCAVREAGLPIVKSRCPADGVTVREQTKEFVQERCRTDHAFRQKTLHALQESGIDGWRPVHSGRGSFAITNEEE